MESSNAQQFTKAISQGITIVDFFAPWCRPCIAFGPTFEKFAQEFKDRANFLKINIEEEQSIAVDYDIISIPTILVFKDGVNVLRKTGSMNEIDFRIWLNEILRS